MLNKYIKNKNNKEVFTKAFVFFIFKICGFLLGYFFTILITRNYGKSTYGLITLAFTIFMIFAVISKLGFDINLTRIVSSGKYSKSQIRNFYLKAIGITFLFSSFIAFIFVINGEFISSTIFMKEEFSKYLFWGIIAMPFWAIIFINAGLFRGLKKNLLFSFFNSFGRFGIASTLLLVYILISNDFRPVAPMVIHFVAVVLLAIISIGIVFKVLFLNDSVIKKESFRPFLIDSLPIFISSTAFILLGWIDRIFLGIFESENDVALFDISAKIALIIGISLEALNSILAPKVSELYYSKRYKELQNSIRFTAKINGLISFCIFILILFFSKELLSIFGEEFEEGTKILTILAIGQIFNCLSGSVGVILQMTGNQKLYRRIMVYALVLNLFLNFILIKPLGVYGVAIATASSMIIWNLMGIYLIRKNLSINSFFQL